MAAGLPGTGIGGIFYMLLVAVMPLRELRRTLSRRSCRARWKTVAASLLLVAAILACLWAEAWLLKCGLQWLVAHAGQRAGGLARATLALGQVAPALAIAPFVILAALILLMHLARLILRPRRARASSRRAARRLSGRASLGA
jgi:hypothetical protein